MLLANDERRVNVAGDGPSGVAAILEGPSDAAIVDQAFDQLQPVYLAFRLPVAPRQHKGGPDRWQILAQALGKAAQFALFCSGQPVIQIAAPSLPHNGVKLAGQFCGLAKLQGQG